MTCLIDTNICIYIMNERPPSVIRKFKQMEVGQVGISSITVSELFYGVSKSRDKIRNEKRLEEFLMPFEILSYDDQAARCYGAIRAELQVQGLTIGPLDMLIAAHALSLNMILITNNEKEFRRIPSLVVENWVV